MEDLKTEIESKDLATLREDISQMLHSADGNNDRLKLTIALQTILEEATKMLDAVDAEAFISDVKKLTDDLIAKSKQSTEEFSQRLKLDNGVSKALLVDTPVKVAELQAEIGTRLNDYESLLKQLIDTRQAMPLEKRM